MPTPVTHAPGAQTPRRWLVQLLRPTSCGMTPHTLRARPLLLLGLTACIAGGAQLRLALSAGHPGRWAVLDMTLGLALCLGGIAWVHGGRAVRAISLRSWGILLGGIGLLALYWTVGRMPTYQRWVGPWLHARGVRCALGPMLYLAAGSLLYRTLLPLAGAWLLAGLRPGQLGWRGTSCSRDEALRPIWPAYLTALCVALPLVLLASGRPSFRRRYPYVRGVVRADGTIALRPFVLGQLAYLLIFVSGESFWRGFLLLGTEADLGLYAIVTMIAPYSAVHYGKPRLELLGASAAGWGLGWLALKHRTFWFGVALHYGVALSMELLAMGANGYRLVIR